MSFTIRNLSVLAYANSFTLWHYKATASVLAEVFARGYFDGVADMLASGDMVLVSAADGGEVLIVIVTGASVAMMPIGRGAPAMARAA